MEKSGPPEFHGGAESVGEAVVAERAKVSVVELGDLGLAGGVAEEAQAAVVLGVEVDAVHSQSSSRWRYLLIISCWPRAMPSRQEA
jgi:hypothetical protein